MGSGTSRCSKGKRHGKLNSFSRKVITTIMHGERNLSNLMAVDGCLVCNIRSLTKGEEWKLLI